MLAAPFDFAQGMALEAVPFHGCFKRRIVVPRRWGVAACGAGRIGNRAHAALSKSLA